MAQLRLLTQGLVLPTPVPWVAGGGGQGRAGGVLWGEKRLDLGPLQESVIRLLHSGEPVGGLVRVPQTSAVSWAFLPRGPGAGSGSARLSF